MTILEFLLIFLPLSASSEMIVAIAFNMLRQAMEIELWFSLSSHTFSLSLLFPYNINPFRTFLQDFPHSPPESQQIPQQQQQQQQHHESQRGGRRGRGRKPFPSALQQCDSHRLPPILPPYTPPSSPPPSSSPLQQPTSPLLSRGLRWQRNSPQYRGKSWG